MKEKMDLSKVKEGIQVPPELGENFERFVLACKKVIYADAFKEDLMTQFTEEQDPVGELIAESAMFGVVTVFNESKGSFPGELMIPVGIFLVADVAEYVEQAGLAPVENEDIGKAMEHYIGLVMNFVESQQGGGAQQTQEQSPEMPAEQPGKTGMIKGEMA